MPDSSYEQHEVDPTTIFNQYQFNNKNQKLTLKSLSKLKLNKTQKL